MPRGDSARAGRYRCSQCDRVFSRSEHRARHERSHSNERPFQCNRCPSTFFRRDLLLRHLRMVHRMQVSINTPLPPPLKSEEIEERTRLQRLEKEKDIKLKEESASAVASASTSPSAVPPSQVASQLDQIDGQDIRSPLMTPHLPQAPAVRSSPMPPQIPFDVNVALPPIMHSPLHYLPPQQLDLVMDILPTEILGVETAMTPNTPLDDSSQAFLDGAFPNSGMFPQTLDRGNAPFQDEPRYGAGFEQMLTPSEPSCLERVRCQVCKLPIDSNDAQGTHSRRVPQLGPYGDLSPIHRFLRKPATPTSISGAGMGILQPLPTQMQIDRYLSAFCNFVYPALPIIHFQTYDPQHGLPALLFAMCAIGAQVCREFVHGHLFMYNARLLLSEWMSRPQSSSKTAQFQEWLAYNQTAVLLMGVLAMTGGKAHAAALSQIHKFLQKSQPEMVSFASRGWKTWREWVDNEQVVRTYWSSLRLMVLLSASSSFTIPEPPKGIDDMRLPCSEVTWGTVFTSQESWLLHVENEKGELLRWSDVKRLAFQGADIPAPRNLSPFHVCLVIMCIYIEARRRLVSGMGSVSHQDPSLGRSIKHWFEMVTADATEIKASGTDGTSVRDFVSLVAPIMGESTLVHSLLKSDVFRASSLHPLLFFGSILVASLESWAVLDMTEVFTGVQNGHSLRTCQAIIVMLIKTNRSDVLDQFLPVVRSSLDIVRTPLAMGMPLFQLLVDLPCGGPLVIELSLAVLPIALVILAWLSKYESLVHRGEVASADNLALYQYLELFCIKCGWHRPPASMVQTYIRIITMTCRAVDMWAFPHFLSEVFDNLTCHIAAHPVL